MPEAKESDITLEARIIAVVRVSASGPVPSDTVILTSAFVSPPREKPADLHERVPCFCGNDKGRNDLELLCQYNSKTVSRITFTGIGDAAVIIVLKCVWG